MQECLNIATLFTMKTDIHPPYFTKAVITCACGNVIRVGSAKEKLDVEICAHCHPFYTGKEKLIDAAGRVQKFQKRASLAASQKPKHKGKTRK